MQSGLEKYLVRRSYEIRSVVRRRDRVVVISALLSFSMIFPAVFLGFILSCVNYILIQKGVTKSSELRLVTVSLIISGISSLVWFCVFFIYASSFANALSNILTIPNDLLFNLFDRPLQSETFNI